MRTVKNFRVKEALVTGKISPEKSRRTISSEFRTRPKTSRSHQLQFEINELFSPQEHIDRAFSPEIIQTQESTYVAEQPSPELLSIICLDQNVMGKGSNVGSLTEKALGLGVSATDLSNPNSPLRNERRKFTFEVLSRESSPNMRSHRSLKPSFSSTMLDLKRMGSTLLSIDNARATPVLRRSQSTNKSFEGKKFIIHKRSETKNFDDSPSHTPSNRNQIALVNKKSSLIIRPTRITKVDKILREVQDRMSPDSRVKIDEYRGESFSPSPDNFLLRSKTPTKGILKKKVEKNNVEQEKESNSMKFSDIAQKLNDFRTFFSSQIIDLKRVRAPLNRKEGSTPTKILVLKKRGKAQEKKGNDEVNKKRHQIRIKFIKTVKGVLRKLALLNMSVDEVKIEYCNNIKVFRLFNASLFLVYHMNVKDQRNF